MLFFFFWVQGWSFSDVMFVTKRNMANAVSNVSKQLEQVSTALAVWLKATSTSSFFNCSKWLTINRLICSSHNEICLVATFHWIFWFYAYFVVNKKTFVPRAWNLGLEDGWAERNIKTYYEWGSTEMGSFMNCNFFLLINCDCI